MQQRETDANLLQDWQEALLLFTVLATPLFVNLWVEQLFEASKVWLLRTMVWALAALWLAGWMYGHRPRPLPSTIRNLIVALFLALLFSTSLSTYPHTAIFGALDRGNGVLTQISYLLLFVYIATMSDMQRNKRLLHAIILTAVPICLLGLAQAAGWQPLPVVTDARSPITTTLGRANFTGAYLAMLLPLTLTAAQAATGGWRRAAYATLVALELIVIALTQARAAWVAVVAGMSVLLWLRAMPRWSPRARWVSAAGGAVVLAGALLLILQRGIAVGGSIAARWTIWQAALRLLWPRLWLGYGADTLELHFPSVYPPQLVYYQGRGVVVDRAHNWLLDWSLSYGVVATAVLLALIYFILRKGVRRLATPEDAISPSPGAQNHEQRWLAACMAAVSAHLIGNLFLFEVAATALLFWILLGIVTAATVSRDTESRHADAIALSAPLRTRQVVAAIGAVTVGWIAWQSNVNPVLADMHSWRATQALHRGDAPTALAEYSMAAKRQPRRSAYHVAAALTAAELGDYARAEATMRAAIALRPTDPVLYTQLAAIYARSPIDAPQAIGLAYDAYEQAIALAPTIALTYRQYADLALRSGDGAAALAQAQKAVDLDATDGVAYGILGWAHLQHGNLTAAQRAFDQAVKWQPDTADFYLGLATAHFHQGSLDAAARSVQHSLMLDPAYAPSLTLQSRLREH